MQERCEGRVQCCRCGQEGPDPAERVGAFVGKVVTWVYRHFVGPLCPTCDALVRGVDHLLR